MVWQRIPAGQGSTNALTRTNYRRNKTMRTVLLVLPNERPVSWNDFYSGQHWSVRKAEKDRVQMVVRSVLDPDTIVFDRPVEITVSAYFDKRPMDSSNIAAKLYEDAIKGWIIQDDDWRHVRSVTTRSHMDRKNPRVEILIEESRL